MNPYHTYQNMYLENYYSPFPRTKSNKEVLRHSQAKKISNHKTIIDIPPSVTLSYMVKNPLYFDIKKHNKRITKPPRPKTANLKRKNSNVEFYKNKNNVINKCMIYDQKKLENILKTTKDQFTIARNKLKQNYELVKGLKYRPMNPRPKLTPKEALTIINKIKFPEPPKNRKIPDYINEFKIRSMIEKEYERLVEEEKGYPPGTFKVWEEDRVLILTNLFLIREELLEQLRHFPVNYYLRSIGIKNRRRETEKKLDEIDFAIKIFQLTDVYLKV